MESKTMWSVAMIGFVAILFCGVMAYVGMGQLKETTARTGNINVKYALLCANFQKQFAASHRVEDCSANYKGDAKEDRRGDYTVEFRYSTRKYLTFAPEKIDLELDELSKYILQELPNPEECKDLVLIRQEITGAGCREKTTLSTKTYPVVVVRKPGPPGRPGEIVPPRK
jgi:hypothetical protein